MACITEAATGAPGYSSVRPNSVAPLAETLKLNGYSTAQFGKCHEVPVWQTSPVGPFDSWPAGGGGFESFYGFIGGEANQWYPTLYEGTTPVENKKTPEQGYNLVADMTDKAIKWIGQQKSLTPDKPFFIYFAPGATHAPHHAPKEWADKYKGKFDQGYDKLREETFARQKKLGGPESYNHYAVGWALAMNTPYQWTKQVASHWGGTRNGTVIHWPKGIKAKGEIRSQFTHVIDVAPTVLDVAGLPQPESVNGIQQDPIEGVSMRYSFDAPKAAEQHETQYFEMFANRGVYHEGWTAVTNHRTPWAPIAVKTPPLEEDVWERYSDPDWTQSKGLAKEMPGKLRELQQQFLIEATRYKVLPLDDRMMERFNPETAGRPVLVKGKTQLLFGGMGRLSENCVLNIKNKSHSLTAEIVVPKEGAEGVNISQGANIGGWSLYAKNGKLKYCYNWGGFKHFFVESADKLPAGQRQVRMEFAYAGGGMGKGGKATLFVDGKKAGEGEIGGTLATIFSADDGCDVGEDSGAAVSPDYGPAGNAFNGEIKGVQLSIADDPNNHAVNPEDAIRAALGRQ